MRLSISHPIHDFTLVESAALSIFMAGGIGITPLLAMMGRLNQLGRTWQLHYSARQQMAFTDLVRSLEQEGQGRAQLYCTAAGNSGRMALEDLVQAAPAHAHLYCCGPNSLIDTFIEATSARSPDTVHYERFASSQEAAQGGFELRLERAGRSLPVPRGSSILEVLLDAGIDVQYACSQGACGTCKLKVLDGIPDHRDGCLSAEEKAANRSIIACCSGSHTPVLALDI
jgi:vanillate O-demethylase ferredoxin subunit